LATRYPPGWISLLDALQHVQRVRDGTIDGAWRELQPKLQEGRVRSRHRGQRVLTRRDVIEPTRWYRAAVLPNGAVILNYDGRSLVSDPAHPSYLPAYDIEVWRADALRWWPEVSPSDATLRPKPDRETREARRGDWIKGFAGRQRIAHRWIAFVDLADWCAHSTTAAGRAEEDQTRDLAWQRIAQSILNAEFERNSRSKVLYLDPSVMGDGGSARCRLTREQFRIAFDIAAAPPGSSLPLLVLVRCWVPRELARQWIETHGYRWPPHFDLERPPAVSVPGVRISSKRWRPSRNRHWKPLAAAIGAVARRRRVRLDQAWAIIKGDIAAAEIKARCGPRRYDHQQGRWIETWRDFDPRWLGFIAYECPEDSHLRFDVNAAERARMIGEQLDPPPEHVRDIVVDAARLDELYPRRGWRKPRQSPLKDVEAAITDSAPDQMDGKKPVTRRPSRQKPFWPEAREAAFAWLDEKGFPRSGDGGQGKLEAHIAGWLTERGHEASESTIRGYVKGWIEKYKAGLSAPE
jgi:hypothetical protein